MAKAAPQKFSLCPTVLQSARTATTGSADPLLSSQGAAELLISPVMSLLLQAITRPKQMQLTNPASIADLMTVAETSVVTVVGAAAAAGIQLTAHIIGALVNAHMDQHPPAIGTPHVMTLGLIPEVSIEPLSVRKGSQIAMRSVMPSQMSDLIQEAAQMQGATLTTVQGFTSGMDLEGTEIRTGIETTGVMSVTGTMPAGLQTGDMMGPGKATAQETSGSGRRKKTRYQASQNAV